MDGLSAARLAGVEVGGTKAIALLCEGGQVIERVTVPTRDAAATLGDLADTLRRWEAQAPVAALGIACFGPIGVQSDHDDYGRMLVTPKPGWSGEPVLPVLAAAVSGSAVIDLDVNGAALAEGRWGAAQGCRDFAYMTVGTGIGVGLVNDGRPVNGVVHPEAGHMRVRRAGADAFPGICEFHGDCLAGLASGPAIEARTGRRGATVADDDPVWNLVADHLAEACANLFLTTATGRIVIGGGVTVGRHLLLADVAARTAAKLGDYLPWVDSTSVVPAALQQDAGPRGALILAERHLSERC